jgi:hypothetical protein
MRTARWSLRPAPIVSQRGDRSEPGTPRPSDAEIRAIAAQLVREFHEPPAGNPGDRLIAQRHELAPAAEERLDAAAAALVGIDPEITMRAQREAVGEAEPRPKWWALDGRPLGRPLGRPDAT